MRSLALVLFLLGSFQSFSQFDYDIGLDGFDDFRIGMSKSEAKKLVEQSDEERTSYAWAPGTMDGRLESYRFKDPEQAYFHGLEIAELQLAFDDEDELIMIVVTLDKEQLNEIVKVQLMGSMVDMFGDTDCSYSVAYDPPPAYCSWGWGDPYRLIVSDMIEPGMGPGESMHFAFMKNS